MAAKRSTTAKRSTAAKRSTVVGAVNRDIAELRAVAPDLADSALAATAVALAREIDKAKNSATSKSMCARALADVLEQLRALTPPQEESDSLDDLTARRDARRSRGAA